MASDGRPSLRTMAVADARVAGAPTGASEAAQVAALARYADALAQAGVDVVQLRDHAMADGQLRRCAAGMVAATAGAPTRVVVNDRAHVSVVSGAAGVHLPSAGMAARRVRVVVAAGALVGRSVHVGDAVDATDEEALDYVVFGTVFASASKRPDHPVAGLDALEKQCRASARPVLAIGGVTVDRCGAVAARGAAGVAAIGAFAEAWRRGQAALDDLVTTMHEAFPAGEAGRR